MISIATKLQTLPHSVNRLQSPEEKMAELKKYFFYKLQSEWKGKCPFPVYWGQKTSHLKELKDWLFLDSICRTSVAVGGNFSKTFFGSLKPR